MCLCCASPLRCTAGRGASASWGISGRWSRPTVGIGAGCALAMTRMEVYAYEALRAIQQAHSSVPMQLYVDDALLQREGPWDKVQDPIVAAAGAWLEAVQRDMEGEVSAETAVEIAKPQRLAEAIRRLLGKYGGLAVEVGQPGSMPLRVSRACAW